MLEDRLTPSSLQSIDLVAQPVAVAPQVASDATLTNFASAQATQAAGTFVTGTTGSATAEGVAVQTSGTDAGSVYVTGLVNDPTATNLDQLAYVVKYGPTGSVVYFAEFSAFAANTGSATEGTGIAVDGSGNVYISGKAHDGTAGTDNGIYLKLDSTGSNAVYFFIQPSGPGGGPVATNSVAIDSAGDAVFVGELNSSPTSGPAVLAARFTSSGTNTYDFS
jgi:hypothetical protein